MSGTCYVDQAGLEFTKNYIPLPLCWDWGCQIPYPAYKILWLKSLSHRKCDWELTLSDPYSLDSYKWEKGNTYVHNQEYKKRRKECHTKKWEVCSSHGTCTSAWNISSVGRNRQISPPLQSARGGKCFTPQGIRLKLLPEATPFMSLGQLPNTVAHEAKPSSSGVCVCTKRCLHLTLQEALLLFP